MYIQSSGMMNGRRGDSSTEVGWEEEEEEEDDLTSRSQVLDYLE